MNFPSPVALISVRYALPGLWWALLLTVCSCQGPVAEQAEVTMSTPPVKLSGLLLPEGELLSSVESACARGPARPIWLQGMELKVQDAQGRELPVQDCTNGIFLQLLDTQRHAQLHQSSVVADPLLLATRDQHTLRLPAGYGLPLYSNETLVLTARWKNEELYKQPQELHLTAKLFYSRKPLVPLAVTVAGSHWEWPSGPEPTYHRWAWPSPPQAEIVAAWPLVGSDCLSLELMRGDDVVFSALGHPGQAAGRLDGGDWSLKVGSRQVDGFQRQSRASLLVYTPREKP